MEQGRMSTPAAASIVRGKGNTPRSEGAGPGGGRYIDRWSRNGEPILGRAFRGTIVPSSQGRARRFSAGIVGCPDGHRVARGCLPSIERTPAGNLPSPSGVMTPNPRTHGDQLSEAELISGARGGEAAAWEAIVGRHREAVFRYAYLQSGVSAEAEDIAQETFLRAFRSFHRFDVSRPLRPWLLRIARNLARNRWRGWSRRLRATERWTTEPTTEAAGSHVEADGGPAQTAGELRGIVVAMREEDRQVIYLRFFLGLSLEETSEALSMPLGTVKSRLS